MTVVHSRFGGSSAERWLNCPGSVALCESIPPKPSTVYALEGTTAHALAAMCLSHDDHPTTYLGQHFDKSDPLSSEITQEMCDAVVVYLEAVSHEQALTKTAELYVEKGFVIPVSTAEPGEVFGTNDALVWHSSTGRLRVFDYKHGQGVAVTADDNAQLKFYAAGAVFSNPGWKIREVVLTIVQPRARDDLGAVRDWTFGVEELLEFVGEVEVGVKRVKTPRGQYTGDWLKTGAHCRWCDASAICPAREAEILKAAQLDFTDMTKITTDDLPIVTELDTTRLGQILKAGALLSDWLATVQEYAEALLMAGTPVEGWKVVEKIGRAKWTSDEAQVASYAEMLFGLDEDAIRPRKLTTIGDAEKLLKAAGASKAEIDTFKLKFTVKESSGLTIAPTSDRRPAIDAVKQDFEGVTT